MGRLDAIRKAGAMVQEISLAPLAEKTGTVHCGYAQLRDRPCRSAGATGAREDGCNPFFAIQFISALAEEGCSASIMTPRAGAGSSMRIHGKGYTDNVVDLHGREIDPLPDQTQRRCGNLPASATWQDHDTFGRPRNRRTTSVRTPWTPFV